MIHKLKALGVALLAALAIGAVGAQAASADLFVSEVNDTVIQTEHEELKFIYSGTSIECEIYDFYGTMPESKATELLLTPTYEGCVFGGNVENFRTNHCAYILTTETVEANEEVHAPLHISCENEGEHIEHEIPSFGHCTLTVAPQTSVRGVTYKDLAGGEITMLITLEVAVVRDNPGENFFCALISAEGNMSITGSIRMEGYEYQSGPSKEYVVDETALTEERGITHWTWGEGSSVEIGVTTEE